MSFRLMKQLILGICGFTLILFLFGSVTYAWVSMAQINNIDGISMTASAGEELQISYDGLSYNTQIEGFQMGDPIELKDVTSVDGIHFTRGAFSSYALAELNKDYLGFDLYFRTMRQERGLFLVNKPLEHEIDEETLRGTYISSPGISFVPKVHYTEENNLLILAQSVRTYCAKDAARISLSELNENDEVVKTIIYDPSENEKRGYGASYGAYSYYVSRTSSDLRLPEVIPNTTYRLSEMNPNNPYQALDNDSLIATMSEKDEEGYRYAKVRIYLWIEGWDADAIDGIIQDIIHVQLEFKLAHPA